MNTNLVDYEVCLDCNVVYAQGEKQCRICKKNRYKIDPQTGQEVKIDFFKTVPLHLNMQYLYNIPNIMKLLQYNKQLGEAKPGEYRDFRDGKLAKRLKTDYQLDIEVSLNSKRN